jgi:DNA-binding CsgD family transcriptional regulator
MPALPSTNPHSLTDQELLVLKHMASGRTTKEIGGLMNISAKTVEYHRARLMGKTNINDVASLTRFAIRNNLIPMTPTPPPATKPQSLKTEKAEEIKTVPQLAQALLRGASQAANGTSDALQINALCQCSDALIRLARLQMEATTEGRKLPWLDAK